MISRQLLRRFTTTATRRSGHDEPSGPGSNLPFSINNRYKLTGLFILFFGSGFAVPFIALRYNLSK